MQGDDALPWYGREQSCCIEKNENKTPKAFAWVSRELAWKQRKIWSDLRMPQVAICS
jgi:hypothetical protein